MKDPFAGETAYDYKAPEHKSSTVRGSYMNDGDSVGVGTGLSSLEGFDSESAGAPDVQGQKSGLTGNTTGRIRRNPTGGGSVSEKGNSFEFC